MVNVLKPKIVAFDRENGAKNFRNSEKPGQADEFVHHDHCNMFYKQKLWGE